MNRYVVRFLNRQVEIEAPEETQGFLTLANQFHEVFALPRYEGYQVWKDNGGLWEAIHGVKDPMYVLLVEMLDSAEAANDNSEEIGQAVIENYRVWRQEIKNIEKHGVRRKYDETLLDELAKRINLVHIALRDLKADLKEIDIFNIFTVLTDERKTSTTQREEQLHVSRATYFRQKALFLSLLGLWIINRVHGNEFDAMVVPYENQHGIGTKPQPELDTMNLTISSRSSEVQ